MLNLTSDLGSIVRLTAFSLGLKPITSVFNTKGLMLNTENKKKEITVWTDGACIPNPGKGGWAWVSEIESLREFGREDKSTNIRMEMMAIISAIESLRGSFNKINIITDSQFVIDGCTKWLSGWKKNGWVKKKGEIKNLELWMKLDSLMQTVDIEFKWVRGHSGDPMNELADSLAGDATGLSFEERLEGISNMYRFKR